MDKFLKIAITAPQWPLLGEARQIEALLRSGAADIVHIRKPDAPEEAVRTLIEAVDPALRPRLTLHSHHHLAVSTGCGGIHFRSTDPETPHAQGLRISRSCHSVDEVKRCPHYDYVFLSPIFPSISKPGYSADFSGAAIAEAVAAANVVALGGVTADRLPQLQAMGFRGAAMLGAAGWKVRPMSAFALQYITNGTTADEVAGEVAAVLAGGCRWVQLRMKDADDATVAEAARRIEPLCHAVGAVLLLDDRVHLVDATGADGVHLGKNDMPAADARKILGAHRIIGSTANTLDDIAAIAAAGATDYIGLGPLRFTTTKKGLAPVLGYDGYRDIVAAMHARGIRLPVVAIGGIVLDDIAELRSAGIDGVAVSGTIRRAPDPAAVTKAFIEELNNTKHTTNG